MDTQPTGNSTLPTLKKQEAELDQHILFLQRLIITHRNKLKKHKQNKDSSNVKIDIDCDFGKELDLLKEGNDWKQDQRIKKQQLSNKLLKTKEK